MRDAARLSDRLLIVILILLLAASTLLLASDPRAKLLTAGSLPGLRPFAAVITLPVAMPTPSDIRQYALPLAVAAVLLVLALTRADVARPAPRWFELSAVAVAAIAVISAIAHASWDLSRGWIFTFAAGAGWAVLLARRASPRVAAFALTGGGAVALIAVVLALAHRQLLEIRHVRWPIGPIAVASELAAVWAAAAIAAVATLVVARASVAARVRNIAIVASLLVAVVATDLLYVTERIAPLFALLVAVAWCTALHLTHHPARRRILAAAVVLVAVSVSAVWIARRADRAASLSLRLTYWKTILDRFPHWAALGVGPDLFVITSTNDLARARAETPHVLHGTLERSAHNEWLQAFFELGLLGGALYLVLPLGALAAALRAFPQAAPQTRVLLAASSTGLVALVVAEAANVNLRYSTVPGWYWTLLGLTVALAASTRPPRPAPAWLPRPAVLRIAAAGLAAALLLITLTDAAAAYAQARGEHALGRDDLAAARWFTLATPRLGAEQWVKVRTGLAAATSDLARQAPAPAASQSADPLAAARTTALELWTELHRRCPGCLNAAGLLAESQLLAGDPTAARETLEKHLANTDPYDAPANLLYAQLFAPDAAARIDCLRRAARSAPVDDRMIALLRRTLTDPAAERTWSERVATATADAARPEQDWQDPLAPETLRLEAARLAATGDRPAAARLGKLAAEAYLRLYNENNPRRRPAAAEADAFARAAEDLFRSDPAQYQAAYDLICEAERFAVLGGELEQLRNPDPKAEFVGGEVVPTDLPENLRPLWRLSALLHLAAGHVQNLELRIRSSLPEDRWSQPDVDAVWVALARELVDAFATLPPDRRPPHYDRLVRLASTAATRPATRRF